LDATVIDLCLKVYDWAAFRRTKGAVKLHMQLDHDGYLPCFAVVTDGKTHDITVARQMRFERGTMLVMDRGYNDYEWFDSLSDQGVHFVTRLKSNAAYEVVQEFDLPRRRHLVQDQDIVFERPGLNQQRRYRIVSVLDPENGQELTFLTNDLTLSPATVAAIYKERWQIELFFKAIKQNLKIKTFLGTSANAVKTQIWTALITMLLVRYLQLKATYGWSLSNLLALLRLNLFVYRDLMSWLQNPSSPPEVPPEVQLQLQFTG
ncbi:MAG: IS4 family transposase, partial [Acidobacteria bacterium]|nr:IS4 family transposase [Acidobacteriota bacterium]